jgi:ketosteroid isomerase-like protein
MSNAQDSFDAIGVVVDWIDACKARRLDLLLDLYDDAATIECCEDGRFRGRAEVERYWRPKFERPTSRTFEIDALMPEAGGVSLEKLGMINYRRGHVHIEDLEMVRQHTCECDAALRWHYRRLFSDEPAAAVLELEA